MKSILVVAAHPDDEVLGCGGTIARHVDKGDKVHILILADGETSRDSEGSVERRAGDGRRAAEVLGASSIEIHDLPDNKLDSIPLLKIVQLVEKSISKVRPSVVYTHHSSDLNIDHCIAHRAVLTACRPVPNCPVEAIYSFEILSSTEWGLQQHAFSPNYFVDISPYLDRKLAAAKCYDNEMRAFPHARSYKSLEIQAKARGASCGLHAAEAFQIVRQLWLTHPAESK